MLTDPLPATLDVRKAATRGAMVEGVLKPRDLPRFRALLASDSGDIRARLHFSRDEQMRSLVNVEVEADVEVTCQRCLDVMHSHLASDNTLAVVSSDEQAAQLPRVLDPLLVVEQACDVWAIVEDELILAMPAFSYHDSSHDMDACREKIAAFSGPDLQEEQEEGGKPNPFDVLAQLKPGDKQQ